MEISLPTRQKLLDIGWDVIRRKLSGELRINVSIKPEPELLQAGGCFASMHRRADHALRGCVGMMDTGQPLAQSLIQAAESVLADPRFTTQPITLAELPDLDLELTALGPLRRRPSPLDFEPLSDGIYLTIGGNAGCFLPQVARETGWSRDQLLARLCTEKLSLPPEAWRNPSAIFQIFSAEVIGPSPMPRGAAFLAPAGPA
ncbi:MAG: AMMECR1 family protein [Planctomycetota bacterium]|nr:AMMECR1 family protein [Planctomycetota bacterium]